MCLLCLHLGQKSQLAPFAKFLPGLIQEYVEKVLPPFELFSWTNKVVFIEKAARGTQHLILN